MDFILRLMIKLTFSWCNWPLFKKHPSFNSYANSESDEKIINTFKEQEDTLGKLQAESKTISEKLAKTTKEIEKLKGTKSNSGSPDSSNQDLMMEQMSCTKVHCSCGCGELERKKERKKGHSSAKRAQLWTAQGYRD